MDRDNNNITYRNLYKTRSLTNLTLMSNDDESTMFESTMLSVPDSLHDKSDNDIVHELSEQKKITKTSTD